VAGYRLNSSGLKKGSVMSSCEHNRVFRFHDRQEMGSLAEALRASQGVPGSVELMRMHTYRPTSFIQNPQCITYNTDIRS